MSVRESFWELLKIQKYENRSKQLTKYCISYYSVQCTLYRFNLNIINWTDENKSGIIFFKPIFSYKRILRQEFSFTFENHTKFYLKKRIYNIYIHQIFTLIGRIESNGKLQGKWCETFSGEGLCIFFLRRGTFWRL